MVALEPEWIVSPKSDGEHLIDIQNTVTCFLDLQFVRSEIILSSLSSVFQRLLLNLPLDISWVCHGDCSGLYTAWSGGFFSKTKSVLSC